MLVSRRNLPGQAGICYRPFSKHKHRGERGGLAGKMMFFPGRHGEALKLQLNPPVNLGPSFPGLCFIANELLWEEKHSQFQSHMKAAGPESATPTSHSDSTLTRCCRRKTWTEAQLYTRLYGRDRCLVASNTIYLLLLAEKTIMVTWK